MLARYFAAHERRVTEIDTPPKPTLNLEWGLSYVHLNESLNQSPLEQMRAYVHRNANINTEFFTPPSQNTEFRVTNGRLSFPSAMQTDHTCNNTVYGRLFETGKQDSIVILLPHWNASVAGHDCLAGWLQLFGISSLHLTLPYHGERLPQTMAFAEPMMSSNIGRTIASFRQSVWDVRMAIDWLHSQGYRRIGILGTSLGGCIGYLVAAHEPRVRVACLNLIGNHVADAAWTGLATTHVRQGLEPHISLDVLREVWSIISPETYIPLLRERDMAMLCLSGRYDAVVPAELARTLVAKSLDQSVPIAWRELLCGHYSFGLFPTVYIAFGYVVRFLKTHL